MKPYFLLLIGLLLSLSVFAQNGKLKIKVLGIKKPSGAIAIALYTNPETFLKESFNDFLQDVGDDNSVTILIDDVPPGTYGLSLFHDENQNGQLDKNLLGIPKEPFAFGNNAMGMFGPPDFKSASINIQPGRVTQMVILLNHM